MLVALHEWFAESIGFVECLHDTTLRTCVCECVCMRICHKIRTSEHIGRRRLMKCQAGVCGDEWHSAPTT